MLQVAPSRIFAAVRQPAFLVHVADTIGAFAEKVCEQLVFNGRLTFENLVQNLAEQAGETDVSELPAQVASAVIALMQERLVEQVCSLCAPYCTAWASWAAFSTCPHCCICHKHSHVIQPSTTTESIDSARYSASAQQPSQATSRCRPVHIPPADIEILSCVEAAVCGQPGCSATAGWHTSSESSAPTCDATEYTSDPSES